MMRFVNKAVLVTGAGSGIGRGIALSFASEGARVAVNDINPGAAEAVAAEVAALGSRGLAVAADVSNEADVRRMVRRVVDSFGRIDILVNSAGVGVNVPVLKMKTDQWDFVMNVNARGTFLCSREAAAEMVKSGVAGKIINISSQAGKTGALYQGVYCASKAAVIALTQVMGLELARSGINVNAVCPGVVDTPMLKTLMENLAIKNNRPVEEIKKALLRKIPLGRIETPDDVAAVVKFLASEDAAYMTGQAINVTGGMERH